MCSTGAVCTAYVVKTIACTMVEKFNTWILKKYCLLDENVSFPEKKYAINHNIL